ncbi:MAG: hypothetical protein IKW21_01450 [Lachnospiraceae bacterium]|nr:hypothetical protein [Lachnospiraceae bacterium]
MKGVKFGDIHSWDNLDLILEPFVVPPAIPKTNLLDIPAGDGSLDLTEAFRVVRYHDRELVFNFTVNPLSNKTFDEKITQVSNALNGKACNIILDRDDDYFWEGRCIVNEHLQDKMIGRIVVKAIVRPYKMKVEETVAEFDLSFDWKQVTLRNSKKIVSPTITCTNNGTQVVYYNDVLDISVSNTFDAGIHKEPYIQLTNGANLIYIAGSGTITFKYREGDL